jgi:very-short-patch-repair endonuclease
MASLPSLVFSFFAGEIGKRMGDGTCRFDGRRRWWMSQRSRNPSPDPSPKRGGEQEAKLVAEVGRKQVTDDPSPKRGGEQEVLPLAETEKGSGGSEQGILPLSASGRGPGGGVAPAGASPNIRDEKEVLPLSASGRRPGGGGVPPTPVPNIVIGQRVDPAKVLRAKELRRQMTPAERRLWNCLRANRLGGLQVRRQQVIDGFIVDFYCHAAAVVVEVDGPVHDDQIEYDAERDRVLTAGGLRVVRFTNEQINRSLADVLRQIEAVCRGG